MSVDTATPSRGLSIGAALSALAALLGAVGVEAGTRSALATFIGICAGFALYHAAFGFTSGWRKFLQEGRGRGLRMQLVLVALTSAVTFPLIAYGETLGLPVRGAIAPVSVAVLVGAFLFGGGMMFAGGCGSGTLFTAGGGSVRMVIALAAFVFGSLIGTLHVPFWRDLPQLGRIGMIDEVGVIIAYGVTVVFLGAIWFHSVRRERRLHGSLEGIDATHSLLKGPWSPLLGVIAIAIVSIATMVLLERPWGITSAFALWGAKTASLVGFDVASWPYWASRTAWLERNVLADPTSVMNFGIIGGAMFAAILAQKFRPQFRLSSQDVGTALLGGLLMGYGARLAYGCNIGAYLGGLISGSLHGMVWMAAAFLGSAVALKLSTGRAYL